MQLPKFITIEKSKAKVANHTPISLDNLKNKEEKKSFSVLKAKITPNNEEIVKPDFKLIMITVISGVFFLSGLIFYIYSTWILQ